MKLRLENIHKGVGNELHLDTIDMELSAGLNVLLGPTLAGKTSLMRLMAGLDKPTQGRILIDGRDVTKLPLQQRSVAFVYQQFINYPSLTVFENIASPLRVKGGLNGKELRRRVEEVATLLHLETFLTRLPAELSGGQQQRIAIARALIKEADLLLLDEPLVNLDYKLREEMRAEMRDIFKQRDAVVVYATTEPYEALLLGGKTAVLDQGRLLQFGSTLEVYHHPASQRVGEVFSDPPMNVVAVTFEGDEALLSREVRFPLPEHMRALGRGAYRIGVRANHVRLEPSSAQDVQIDARVELAEISGSETFVHADHRTDTADSFRLVAQFDGVHSLDYGHDIQLYLDPKRLYVFNQIGELVAVPKRTPAPVEAA